MLSAKGNDVNYSGTSKITAYKWTITGKPAEFAWLDKNQLYIDRRYQRKVSNDRALLMAREWDWVACGALSIALREDAQWFVIDGQHRLEAAKKRSDITDLPCLIFEVEHLSDEARGFLSTNIGRKPMRWAERFKAMVEAGDPLAATLEWMIDGSGRRIANLPGPYSIACLAELMKQIRLNEKHLRIVWPVALKLCQGNNLIDRLIRGLIWVEKNSANGFSLGNPRWTNRLCTVGFDKVSRSIMSSLSTRVGGSSERACGLGVLEALNQGLRNKYLIRNSQA